MKFSIIKICGLVILFNQQQPYACILSSVSRTLINKFMDKARNLLKLHTVPDAKNKGKYPHFCTARPCKDTATLYFSPFCAACPVHNCAKKYFSVPCPIICSFPHKKRGSSRKIGGYEI